MAQARVSGMNLATFLDLFRREDRWLILINADPDAMASAKALKRIMTRRATDVGIAHVNEISRPDNLAMLHYLRIPTQRLTPELAAQYDRFALVDSQPHHSPEFSPFHFSLVIDHHPLVPEEPVTAEYADVRPEYGATSTILTEYLNKLRIRPGKILATALLCGIKADTQSFERCLTEVDVRAFRFLSKFADPILVRNITRSEFKLDWLKYFWKAFSRMRSLGKVGLYVFLDEVENPDILVILADFFLRVQEILWTAVGGMYDGKAVVVFRSDGYSRNVGRVAEDLARDLGVGGGHKSMARAEIPLEKFEGRPADIAIYRRLIKKR